MSTVLKSFTKQSDMHRRYAHWIKIICLNTKSQNKISLKMVKFLTIKSILSMHNFDKLNLLQIDAEGHDYTILKSIDYDLIKPQIIRFETTHMSKSGLNEVLEVMSSHNYKFHPENRDITAIL